jgi:hypothetical protein
MQELTTQFCPADGTAPRTITLRIGSPVKGETCWSALVEVLGFDEIESRPIFGEDWAQAIEQAAMLLPIFLQCSVAKAGGGTLEPSFYERDPQPPDLSKLPPEVAAIFRRSDDSPAGAAAEEKGE